MHPMQCVFFGYRPSDFAVGVYIALSVFEGTASRVRGGKTMEWEMNEWGGAKSLMKNPGQPLGVASHVAANILPNYTYRSLCYVTLCYMCSTWVLTLRPQHTGKHWRPTMTGTIFSSRHLNCCPQRLWSHPTCWRYINQIIIIIIIINRRRRQFHDGCIRASRYSTAYEYSNFFAL